VSEQESAADRVQRGAAWLDERSPGWERRVRLRKLDEWSDRSCMLAQVWGMQYPDALKAARLTDARAMELGFQARLPVLAEYAALTQKWKEEALARLRRR
jgi:hypothetical protein